MINEPTNHHPSGNENENENTSSWTGRKIHELSKGASEMGHLMRGGGGGVWRNLGFGRRRTGGDATSDIATATSKGDGGEELEMGKNGKRPTTADTLVADEDMEGPWVSDARQDEEGGVIVTPTLEPGTGSTTGGDAGQTMPVSSIPQERTHPISQPDAVNVRAAHGSRT